MKDLEFHNSAHSSSDAQTSRQFMKNLLNYHLLTLYYNQLSGNIKACSLIVIIFACCVCRYTSVEIMPELKKKKNILNFGYGINFKNEGMLAHSFDRFYVVTKFILPLVNDLKLSPLEFNEMLVSK